MSDTKSLDPTREATKALGANQRIKIGQCQASFSGSDIAAAARLLRKLGLVLEIGTANDGRDVVLYASRRRVTHTMDATTLTVAEGGKSRTARRIDARSGRNPDGSGSNVGPQREGRDTDAGTARPASHHIVITPAVIQNGGPS